METNALAVAAHRPLDDGTVPREHATCGFGVFVV